MKSALLFVILLFISPDSTGLDEIRTNYNKAVSDKALCEKMITELSKTQNESTDYLAYLGGFQAIWANHVFSPVSKLSTFNKGKKNIERAIKKEPDNAEYRFIRLSIQKNVPSILGYKSNIKEDTEFLKSNQNQIKSQILQKNIEALLKN
ncbi:hypothetical protein AAEO57_07065 [Flavobacterium sp. DGU38]|uniref:Uncharacterized protein n=1 Tax=Flavobacterium calami TaxID=3139144 RepID=A0ABU9IMU4_9FLAO